MPTEAHALHVFQQHRHALFNRAYQILGSVHDAEDVLQDVFLQWHEMDLSTVESEEAVLRTMTARRAIDRLRLAARKRETYIGPWLPEPLRTESDAVGSEEPERIREVADELSLGFMMLLESLNASERAVYLLRSAFDYNFSEIAAQLDLSNAHCRKLWQRANEHLRSENRRFDLDHRIHARLLGEFESVIRGGDVGQFAQALADDVVLYSDGGGKALSALRPILGRGKVVRLISGLANKCTRGHPQFEMVEVNLVPSLLWYDAGNLQTVVSFCIENGLVTRIALIRNPDKLRLFERINGE